MVWSHEAISAERYRPLLTDTHRRKLLTSPDSLSRVERQRLREIALAGIYDLTFLLSTLPNDDRRKVFSHVADPRLRENDWFQELGEAWQLPPEFTLREDVQDYVSTLPDRFDSLPNEATRVVLDHLDADPSLADATIDSRQELFEYQAQFRLLEFDRVLNVLMANISVGLESNGVSVEEVATSNPDTGKTQQEWSDAELRDLTEFESDLEELAEKGSLIGRID